MFFKLQFGTPIANAWTLHGDQLSSVSIFDENNVPALTEGTNVPDNNEEMEIFPNPPLLYVGKNFSTTRNAQICRLICML